MEKETLAARATSLIVGRGNTKGFTLPLVGGDITPYVKLQFSQFVLLSLWMRTRLMGLLSAEPHRVSKIVSNALGDLRSKELRH